MASQMKRRQRKRVERGRFTVRSALLHVVNMPQKKNFLSSQKLARGKEPLPSA
jgi:hypothetical protein